MKSAARTVAFVAMAGTLCASSIVFADESIKTPPPDTNSAMRVVVDPETGEVRAPSADELVALIQAENAARAAESSARVGLRAAAATSANLNVLPETKSVQRHANGMVSVKMSQDSLSLVTAETAANGKTKLGHAGEISSHSSAQEK